MIDNFLRPPRGVAEHTADVLRVVGLLSLLLAVLLLEWTDVGIIAFTLPSLMAPRFIGMRPWPDIMVSVTLLVVAWSNLVDLYARISWWDLVVHFFCAGVLAVGCYLLFTHLRLVPAPSSGAFSPRIGIVLTTAFGLALSALWEMIEWVGYTYITTGIHVTYDDTITDMIAGGLGALVLSLGLAHCRLLRNDREGTDDYHVDPPARMAYRRPGLD